MAVKVQQVLEILEQIAPPELACSWDNVGLLVDAGRPVTSIMTALDITADVVRDAAESGCELIVSHHPVIFDPLRRVTAEDVPAMLLQNGISAICMHTNLDAAPGGVNDVLADLLRIENRRDFADNCGRIGTLNVPTTAQQLAETCSRMLHTHCKFVEADHPVEKLAEVSGAGGSYLQQAIDEGADCLVTGEAAHHIAILAKQKGVGLVVAGHWGTEHPVVFALIFEPTRDEVLMTLRTRTQTFKLLLSARSGSARVCLTKESFENPLTPPGFCMLLRKHLTGGRLTGLHMEPGDRIVFFDFLCTNEMGDLVTNTLAAELMGRYSNLVLIQSGKIIDALKRVDFEDSEIRQLLPGLPYTLPPKPNKPDFLATSAAAMVAAACEKDLPVASALGKAVGGVGPVVAREAVWRAFGGETPLLACDLDEAQKQALCAAIENLKDEHAAGGTPTAVRIPQPDGVNKPVEFSFFIPQQYGSAAILTQYPTYSELLEDYYATKDRAERLKQKSRELYKAVHNLYERAVRKQSARREELAQSEKADTLRLYGELLQANQWAIQKGDRQATVQNYYTGEDVTIRLDPRLGPNENAQKYFRDYKKKQTAGQMLKKLLLEGEDEIEYLANVLYEVETAPGEQAGAKVPVDTTEVRNIWKANGARPGMVLYNDYTTVYITPRAGLEEQLREK